MNAPDAKNPAGTGFNVLLNQSGIDCTIPDTLGNPLETLPAFLMPSPDPVITYTVFPNLSALIKQQGTMPWSQFVELIRNPPEYPSKAACPLIKLARFGEVRTPKMECLRNDGNVQEVTGVELDYDAGAMTLEQAADKLRQAGILAALYTSPSHTPAAPRWRVLAPLATAHQPIERAELVSRINGVLDMVAAPESFTLSQTFYIGRVTGAEYQSAVVHGRPIDTLALPATAMPTRGHKQIALPESYAEMPANVAEVLALIPFGEGKYLSHWLPAVLGTLNSFGAVAVPLLLEWCLDYYVTKCPGKDLDTVRQMGTMDLMDRLQAEGAGLAAWENVRALAGLPRHDVAAIFRPVEQPAPAVRSSVITWDKWNAANLTPRTIVADLLYADVRTRFAAGGTGKTTLALFEAVTLALGRPVWGKHPAKPVRTLMVTREDGEGVLIGRVREICNAMFLNHEQIEQVMGNLRILDLSADAFRLSCVQKDLVVPNMAAIEWLIEHAREFAPDWLIFDPVVSFGVGESRVNDAEQGLIEAFRVLRNRLDCCVEGIHHTGKQNSREKTLDQYSGRGGSALPDGSRMVVVMQPMDAKEWGKATGMALAEHESGMVMALPKLSYTKPQEHVYIRRNGFAFFQSSKMVLSSDETRSVGKERLAAWIEKEFDMGHWYSSNELERFVEEIGLSRGEIRKAVVDLKNDQRFIYHDMGNGKKGSHFEPVKSATSAGVEVAEVGVFRG